MHLALSLATLKHGYRKQTIMSRSPSFAFKSTSKKWLVHVPAGLSDTGKLSRRYFHTRDEAKAFAGKLRGNFKDDGVKASVLSPRAADDACLHVPHLRPPETIRPFRGADQVPDPGRFPFPALPFPESRATRCPTITLSGVSRICPARKLCRRFSKPSTPVWVEANPLFPFPPIRPPAF